MDAQIEMLSSKNKEALLEIAIDNSFNCVKHYLRTAQRAIDLKVLMTLLKWEENNYKYSGSYSQAKANKLVEPFRHIEVPVWGRDVVDVYLGIFNPTEKMIDSLTPRQIRVAQLFAQGMSKAEIVKKLLLSKHTITSHIGGFRETLCVPHNTRLSKFQWQALLEKCGKAEVK